MLRPACSSVNYREYVEQRREKKSTGFGFLFFVGGGFVLVGLILMLVFYFV